jgi:antitoxin (DNA-binding transcriptional repressor) of toxin-antitoxin stability system
MAVPEPMHVSVSEARARWAEILDAIEAGDGLRVVVERHGKPLAVLAHPEELRILDAIEDRFVQLEVDRLRKAGSLDDGETLTTEEVAKHVAATEALKLLGAAVQRVSDRSANQHRTYGSKGTRPRGGDTGGRPDPLKGGGAGTLRDLFPSSTGRRSGGGRSDRRVKASIKATRKK